MYIFLSILILLAALLMIGAVLIQKSKGGGLASNFSGANQVMGVRKSTDFIEKATWTLAIFIVVCSIISSFFIIDTLVQGSRIVQQPIQQEQSTPFATEQAPVAAPADSAK
jgi:preprotein translocase subunit SecG